MNVTQRDRDLGTAYARERLPLRTELTAVARGTPMGELLRRYWHPVGLAGGRTDTPQKVRMLGEDLILFRDRHGRPDCVQPRCCHRGTTLYYGKVEDAASAAATTAGNSTPKATARAALRARRRRCASDKVRQP